MEGDRRDGAIVMTIGRRGTRVGWGGRLGFIRHPILALFFSFNYFHSNYCPLDSRNWNVSEFYTFSLAYSHTMSINCKIRLQQLEWFFLCFTCLNALPSQSVPMNLRSLSTTQPVAYIHVDHLSATTVTRADNSSPTEPSTSQSTEANDFVLTAMDSFL